MADTEKSLSKQEKFGCRHYNSENGCIHPKTSEIKTFLISINAIGKDFVDTNKWTPEEWQQYCDAMSKLPNGTDRCNLPTGRVTCDWINIPGLNPNCDDWDCQGRRTYQEVKNNNPDSLIRIR
jgi:hypothetical protein